MREIEVQGRREYFNDTPEESQAAVHYSISSGSVALRLFIHAHFASAGFINTASAPFACPAHSSRQRRAA
jgi:hypothetical protein